MKEPTPAAFPEGSNSEEGVLLSPESIRDILQYLPHRYPFILVDRVTKHVEGKVIHGYKNVTINEPFFQGHFPGDPIMPGVLQLEAMAQLGILLMARLPAFEGKLGVFAGMDHVRFRRMVIPGDRLDMTCTLTKMRVPIAKMFCQAFVDGEMAVEAEIICSLVDREVMHQAKSPSSK